jgi:methyl-accepting chemotaxis protein
LYEQSKLDNIKSSLVEEMAVFRTTIEKIYESSESDSEATASIYAFLNNHRWDNDRYFFAYDASSFISKAYGSDRTLIGSNGYNGSLANW